MRFFKFLLVFLILPVFLFAGTKGKIVGTIVDESNGQPLPGVNVILQGTQLGAATDIDGAFLILNIPAGTYTVEISYIGYRTLIMENVRVQADLTTKLDIELEQAVMDLEDEIVVTAQRPIIQQDLTSSRTILSNDEIQAIPFENVENVVNITPGVVGGNFRGGRGGETLYQIDGVTTIDPWNNAFDTDIPEMAIEEISIITGGFSAEYGNAQSGVVNMVVREGGPDYQGSIRYKTSDYGDVLPDMTDSHALQNVEFSFGGPEPLTNLFNVYNNKIKFFMAGEWRKDNGRFPNDYIKAFNLQTKLSWIPSQKHKVTFSYLGNWEDQGNWGIRWTRPTHEDKNPSLDPSIPGNEGLSAWFNNGQLDKEDVNGNGFLDDGEDINGNGILDSEDLNQNGSLDRYSMLDHLPYFELDSDNLILNWTYQLGAKSYFETKLSRYRTAMHYNVNENINEDFDGDGVLDLYVGGVDLDGDGDNSHEDLNGNNLWDWKMDGGKTDLYYDNNNNGYIDASEGNPRDQWILWEEIPKIGNTQDNDGYYTYGNGTTHNRARWNFDEKFTYALKMTFYNQLNRHNEIKMGFESQYFDMADHDIDLASGGNVYGQNIKAYPYTLAAFFEDKMEYEGMILNAGLRVDYFKANDESPADPNEPFIVDENGQLGYNNVKDTKGKLYWSPRLGISHPITDRDVIYFNYGRYFQIPQFSRLYTNASFQLVGAFPIIGNPNIEPETTTSYEVGVKHSFNDDMKVEAKGFYKDIQGLTDLYTYFYNAANWAGIYSNTDFGNVRGFEVQLYKRFSRYWGGTLNYTYSIAKGKSSSATQNYSLTWAGDVIPTDENFLNWDQRHTVNFNLNMRIPSDENLFGISAFNDMGFNAVFQYGSGLPYSSIQRTRIPPINDKRRPATYDLDMIFDKRIPIGAGYDLKFFLWGNNLLEQWANHVNIVRIADVNYYDGDQDGDGKPDEDPTGRYNDPSVYSQGTTWRVGVQFDF